MSSVDYTSILITAWVKASNPSVINKQVLFRVLRQSLSCFKIFLILWVREKNLDFWLILYYITSDKWMLIAFYFPGFQKWLEI